MAPPTKKGTIMTLIAPSTDIYLLKLPIELDDENQLTFATATAQYNYFSGLSKIALDDGTYQRRDNAIRYPGSIDSIIEYNYCMYKNAGHGNKWFYARISNMQYVNDNMTLVEIEEDSFQTWQFDLVYSQCFVEREHVNDDTIGAHTIPENLETGPVAAISRTTIEPSTDIKDADNNSYSFLQGKQVVCFLTTSIPASIKPTHFFPWNGKTFTGMYCFAVIDELAAASVIRVFQEDRTDDNIVTMFMAPIRMFNGGYYEQKTVTIDGQSVSFYIMTMSELSGVGMTDLSGQNVDVPMPNTLYSGYAPRNNKLFCWPYNYLMVSNIVGETEVYHYEDFTNNSPAFRIWGVLSAGCATKLIPQGFKQTGPYGQYRAEYSVNGRKYPVCAWPSDSFTNWLTQNGVNAGVGLAGAGIGALTGAVTGNPLAVIGSAMSVANSIGSIVQATKMPDRARGDLSMGDWAQAAGETFVIYKQSIRPEYAAVLDSYFDAYGYKVNQLKIPNITGRTNWNYVKTNGSCIHAYIPQEAVDRINGMFDNGITLWHNPATFRDYSQSNAIVQ